MNNLKLTRSCYIEAARLGQIGAGKVVPFPQQIEDESDDDNKIWIPLPKGARTFDKFAEYEVCGDSLQEIGIKHGYKLTCRTNFELWEVKPDKVCIVYINSTNEKTAKMVRLNNDGTVTLCGANAKYKPKTYFADEIEILALVIEARWEI